MRKRGGKADFARGVCDSIRDSKPDMYNSPAKRVVPLEEAEQHGWAHYFDGTTTCSQGHIAARYVVNHALCVDCKRLAEGKPPIYSPTSLVHDLTGAPVFVNPLASAKFAWSDEKTVELLSALVNTTDMIAACKVVGCQPLHVIDRLASDAEFKAAYEDAKRKVEQVQLWSMEARAASGNDRVALAQAQSKFSEFGAKSGLADRTSINPEQMRAELAQILSRFKRAADQQDRLRAAARANRGVGQADTPGTVSAVASVEEPPVLAGSHDNRDMVS